MSDVEADLSIWISKGKTKDHQWDMWLPRDKAGKSKSNYRAKAKDKADNHKNRPLSPNVLDCLYRATSEEVGLSDRAKADLIRRGIDVSTYLGFSISKDSLSPKAINKFGTDGAKLFPGADDRGHLYFSGEGYTVPAFDTYGRVIGYQVRYFDLDNRYSWASTNNKVEIEGELELPLTQLSPSDSKILYLTEGLLKPFVASSKLGINVLGGAGGNLASSPKQLALALEGYEQVIWAVDAGAINNNKVLRQYLRADKLIKQLTGIDTQYLWYGQTNKETGKDIDEIDTETFNNAQVISLTELLEIAESYGIDTNALVEYWESGDTASEKDAHVDINDNTESESDAEARTGNKTLVITENFDVYQRPKQANQDVIYVPSLYVAEMNQTLSEIDLFKYQDIELVRKQGVEYLPWLEEKTCETLRFLNFYLERLTGVTPIGDTKNGAELNAYLGLIENNEDPYYADTSKLTLKGTKIYRDNGGRPSPKLMLRTSRGSLPLGATAYYGAHLPLQNANRDSSGKYLPKLDLLGENIQYQGAIVGIRAGMGAGKTTAINDVAAQIKTIYGIDCGVTALSPTINLNRQLAEKIDDCISINDYKGVGLSPTELDIVTRDTRISLCLNSLWQCSSREYGEGHILVLEEIETVLESFLDPKSHYENSKKSDIRRELARAIKETVNNQGIVLVLDADLKDITLTKLAEFAGVDPTKIVKINHDRTDKGFNYTFASSKKAILGEIFTAINRGERRAIACDSKKSLQQINKECLARGIEDVYVLHRDTIAHPDYRAFAEDPNGFLETHKPRVFGYNSVIGTGFDITYGEFDRIFVLAHGVLTPNQIRQLIMRFRTTSIPRYIWANESAVGSPETIGYKPSEIRQEQLDDITSTLSSVGLSPNAQINYLLAQPDPLLDIRSLQLAKADYQQYGYKKAIEGGLLLAQNCTHFEHNFTFIGSLKEAKEAIEHQEAKLLDEVEIITDHKAFKALDAKAYKTDLELAQYVKTVTANKLPGVNIDYRFAREYIVSSKGSKQLSQLQGLGDALYTDISTAITRNYFENRIADMVSGKRDHSLFTEIKSKTQKYRTLSNLGIAEVIQTILLRAADNASINDQSQLVELPEKVEVHLDSPAIKHFLEKFTKNLSYYAKKLKLRINEHLTSSEKFKRLLRLVGIKVTGIGKTVTVTIPHDFLAILVGHYKSLVKRYNKLDSKGKIPKPSDREEPDISPLQALSGRVSELTVTDIEVIKEVILNLVGLNNTSNRPRGGATCVGAGNKSPNAPPS